MDKSCDDENSTILAGSCSFESPDLCGWTDVSSGEYQWLRNWGATPSRKTGPKNDHTCGNYSCKLDRVVCMFSCVFCSIKGRWQRKLRFVSFEEKNV